MTQKIDNGVLPAFTVEAEQQPDGSQRQVVKIAEVTGEVASAISEGSVSVATPGTAVVLGSSLATKEIILSALDTNTAPVTVGGSGVLTTTGMRIFPGAMATIKIDNRNKVYVNSSAVATVQYTAFS